MKGGLSGEKRIVVDAHESRATKSPKLSEVELTPQEAKEICYAIVDKLEVIQISEGEERKNLCNCLRTWALAQYEKLPPILTPQYYDEDKVQDEPMNMNMIRSIEYG